MRVDPGGRGKAIGLLLAFGLMGVGAACTASEATPATAVPTSNRAPIILPDVSAAATAAPTATPIRPSPTASPTASPTHAGNPFPSLEWSKSDLPPAVPFHGRVLVRLPKPGSAGNHRTQLLGVAGDRVFVSQVGPGGADDTACVAECLRIFAYGLDGAVAPGWTAGGLPIGGEALALTMNASGTIFVRSESREDRSAGADVRAVTIAAIGSNGRMLPGWPYVAPKAPVSFSETLVAGPDGSVCFTQNRAVASAGSSLDEQLYCVGPNGRLLPGWPFTARRWLSELAVGPTGNVFAAVPDKAGGTPSEVVALDRNGRLLPGWPWRQAKGMLPCGILPRADGGAAILLGTYEYRAGFDVVDAGGRLLFERFESAGAIKEPIYTDAAMGANDRMFVAVGTANVGSGYLAAYAANGGVVAGWPRPLVYWTRLFVGRSVVWSLMNTPGRASSTIVTAFNLDGSPRAGFPMTSDLLGDSPRTFVTGGDDTLYGVVHETATDLTLVAIAP